MAQQVGPSGGSGGGSGGITNSAGANVLTKSDGTNLVASRVTESGVRDNVPALSGGNYDATFFSSSETGFVLTDVAPAAAGYTPNGLLVIAQDADADDASPAGAVIGVRDIRTGGSSGSIASALNLDAIKVTNADLLALVGLSIFVWNQGSGDIGALDGIQVSLESDDGEITGNVNGIRVLNPSMGGDVTGRLAGITIESQNIPATSGAYAVYYEAPSDNFFSVAADGHLQVGATITPPATVGAQEINKNAGSVNFAIAATSLVVTCNKCTTSSIVLATVATNDATGRLISVVPANGSFTINVVAPAAEMRVNWWVLNQ